MTREEVIARLRAHEDELKQAGIAHLGLFGSAARGEPGQDVDVVVAFDERRRLSLLDVIGLEQRLTQWLGTTVDLVPDGTWKGLGARARRAGASATGFASPANAAGMTSFGIVRVCRWASGIGFSCSVPFAQTTTGSIGGVIMTL